MTTQPPRGGNKNTKTTVDLLIVAFHIGRAHIRNSCRVSLVITLALHATQQRGPLDARNCLPGGAGYTIYEIERKKRVGTRISINIRLYITHTPRAPKGCVLPEEPAKEPPPESEAVNSRNALFSAEFSATDHRRSRQPMGEASGRGRRRA